MRKHLVIRRPEFVAGSRHQREVGVFTQTHSGRHPVPWGKIALGEPVWMKWAGGPVVANTHLAGLRQMEDTNPMRLKETTSANGTGQGLAFLVPWPARSDDVVKTAVKPRARAGFATPNAIARGWALRVQMHG